jgi:hypothetical protein
MVFSDSSTFSFSIVSNHGFLRLVSTTFSFSTVSNHGFLRLVPSEVFVFSPEPIPELVPPGPILSPIMPEPITVPEA